MTYRFVSDATDKTRRRFSMAVAGLGLLAMPLAGCVEEAPPPGVSGSPGAAPGYGYVCYAGVYQCRTPQQLPVGTPCSCPGIGAPSFGHVR